MSAIELLLSLDKDKLELPSAEVEINRLSNLTGKQVIFKLKGVKQSSLNNIREMVNKFNPETKQFEVDEVEMRLATILEGVVEPNLRDKTLMEHYGVKTPYDLLKKVFSLGEIEALYGKIAKLSGFGEDVINEIKN